jgi:hypothetical protein
VANTDFDGGCDGRDRGVRQFFGQIGPTRPYGFALRFINEISLMANQVLSNTLSGPGH